MGEKSEFVSGDKAPNNGIYIEVGSNQFHMGINNPKQVKLSKGDEFPETTNDDRKWVRKEH